MKIWHVKYKWAGKLIISFFIFILTIEVSARIDDKIKYGAPFFCRYSSERLRAYDADGIRHNIPNSHFEKWKINRLGFRGPNISLKKSNGTIRIICMGTSETFGLYENPNMEWSAQLRDILDKHHSHFQVINASVVGLTLDKFLPYIKKYVLKLEPDIIILYVNPFSYGSGIRKFEKRQVTHQKTDNKTAHDLVFIIKKIISEFRMFPKIKQTIKNILPAKVLKWKRQLDLSNQIRVLENRYLNGKKPLDIVSHESLQRFQDDLKEIVQYLQDLKISVVLSTYPALITYHNINEHREIFLDHRRFYIELSLKGIIDTSRKFNELIKKIAAENRIDFVDNNAAIPKNLDFFADDVHYTNEGARMVAMNFANYISKQWTN